MIVPILSDMEIENAANSLLASFEAKHGRINTHKTPVEEIAELHLGYSLELADLDREINIFGYEVHGRINFNSKIISINSKLEPNENPQYIGRFMSTLGHEIGHAVLHKSLMEGNDGSYGVLHKTKDTSATIEWQADRFSWFLLLPKERMYWAWRDIMGSYDRVKLSVFAEQFNTNMRIKYSQEQLAEIYLKDFARNLLNVSPRSLLTRLRSLGLIV